MSRSQHSFAWLFFLATMSVLFISSSFNLNFSDGGLNDRYLFYVLPLIAVAAVVALVDRHVPWRTVAGAGIVTALLVQFGHFDGYPGRFWVGAPASAIDPVLNGKLWNLNDLLGTSISIEFALTIAAFAVTALTVLLCRKQRGPIALTVITVPVLIWLVAQTQYQYDSQGSWSRPTPSVIKKSLRTKNFGDVDWIDKAVPSGSVAVLPSVTLDQVAWWQDEFFNRRVDKMFRFVNPSQPELYQTSLVHLQLKTLFHDELRVDPRSGAITGLARDRMTPKVVMADTDARFGFAGARTLLQHRPSPQLPWDRRLLEVDVPYRAAWLLQNLLDDGWTVGAETRLLLFPRRKKNELWNVALRLASTADLKRSRYWSVRAGRGTLARGRLKPARKTTTRVSICVRPTSEPTIIGLRVPEKTKLPDGRSVGLMLSEVQASPTGRSCRLAG